MQKQRKFKASQETKEKEMEKLANQVECKIGNLQTELATLANKMGEKLNAVDLEFEKCDDLLKEVNLNEKKELEKLVSIVDGKIEKKLS